MTSHRPLSILRICPEIPYPPTDGVRIEPFYTIRELARFGHSLTVLSFHTSLSQDAAPLKEFCSIHSLPFHGRNSIASIVRGVIQSIPPNYIKYRNAVLLDICFRLLRNRTFDLVIVDFSQMGWYVEQIKNRFWIPVITRWHNVDTIIWQRWALAQGNPLKRLLGLWQVQLVSVFERQLAQASDLCLVVSAKDQEMIRNLAPNANIRYIPAGVDTEYYAPFLDVPVEPGSILYLSSGYKWHANVDAAKWLYYEIMPRIWENMPEAKLYISGREPPVEMQRWASERVVLTGFVPDERKLLARANVVVVPMRLGGGIKLRILTALSLGKAVVTTPQGAEGIAGLVDGQHALVRDNAEAFAEAVVEIIRRPELCYQLGIHGRQLMRTFYDWKIVGAQWNDAITKIVEAYS